MKGLAPRIFGLAVERGALTREIAGTSMTFRVNPVGTVKALQGAGLLDVNDDYARSTAQRFAGRFFSRCDVRRLERLRAGVFHR
jgi:hypothetical protein